MFNFGKFKDDFISLAQGLWVGFASNEKPLLMAVVFVFVNRFGGLLFDFVHKQAQQIAFVKKHFPVK